jgi:hypothetical protein
MCLYDNTSRSINARNIEVERLWLTEKSSLLDTDTTGFACPLR